MTDKDEIRILRDANKKLKAENKRLRQRAREAESLAHFLLWDPHIQPTSARLN